ncbi:conserved oligomeric Golgi complex subunit 6 [Endozoicomonas sp. Mp262]|uniref:conserved oligomeric Golgi complex subunit 6 n=1 Tax=Endozoicomonas sp. Mp262 TaxID=2919499 RepID=UPI0021D85AF0
MARKKPNKAATGFDGIDIGYLGSRDEPAEERTVESRKKLRESLSNQVEEFLKKGGKIQEIPTNVTADPPKKPNGDYGNRPI